MYLICGLGNPGKIYERTRHNVGFRAVDFLTSNQQKWHLDKKSNSLTLTTDDLFEQKTEVIKPQTFMNNSGQAIAYVARYHHLTGKKIIVIYDELDLPFGTLRVRPKGSAAGHNGIKSIISHLKTEDFWHIRIGIRSNKTVKTPADKFVLQKFTLIEEKNLIEKIFPQIKQEIEKIINLQ